MFKKLKNAANSALRSTSPNRSRAGSNNSANSASVQHYDDTMDFDALMERGANYRESIHKQKEAMSRMSTMDQCAYQFEIQAERERYVRDF